MPITTDEMYNASSREIHWRVDIYFDMTPVTITRDNYLVNCSLLEECSGNDKMLFSKVTSNEVSICLYNQDKIFTPTNKESPYYGKIKKGVLILVYCTPDLTCDWDILGAFYVTDWITSLTSTEVDIVANDSLLKLLSAPKYVGKAYENISFTDFFRDVFIRMNAASDVDDTLTTKLKIAYNLKSNQDFLSPLTNAALAYCYHNHHGTLKVTSMIAAATKPLRATITEHNQLIDIKMSQSIESDFDHSAVYINTPKKTNPVPVLTLKNIVVAPGTKQLDKITLTKQPLISLSYSVVENSNVVSIRNIYTTPTTATLVLHNSTFSNVTTTITVYGVTIENEQMLLSGVGENPMELDSMYVQDSIYANMIKVFLDNAIANQIPFLEVVTRGNCKFNLCDKIRVISATHKLDYVGIIIKQIFDYDGGLSSKLTLLNTKIFGDTTDYEEVL